MLISPPDNTYTLPSSSIYTRRLRQRHLTFQDMVRVKDATQVAKERLLPIDDTVTLTPRKRQKLRRWNIALSAAHGLSALLITFLTNDEITVSICQLYAKPL